MNQKAIEILLQEFDPKNETHKRVISFGIRHTANGILGKHDDYVYEMYLRGAVKALPYEKFLKTLYWNAVSHQVKKVGKCQVCSSYDNLEVHHNTYDNHGREHEEHIQKKDLVCLCSSCHELFHKNKENGATKIKLDIFDLNTDIPVISFEDFWDLYNKKVGKGTASARYFQLRKNGDLAVKSMTAFLEYYLEGDENHKMDPSRYLNCFLRGRDIKLNGCVYFYKDGVMYVR